MTGEEPQRPDGDADAARLVPPALRGEPGPPGGPETPPPLPQPPSADPAALPPSAFPAPPLPSATGSALPAQAPPAPAEGPPGMPPRPPRWQPPSRGGEPYPMRFDVAYPERLSRWKTLLRGLLIIPAWIYFALASSFLEAGFVLGWIPVFLKRKYPSWLFAGLSGAIAFNARTAAYGLLLTDRYPSFDPEAHPAVLEYSPPLQGQLSRWRVFFWKVLLLVPHVFVLAFLWVAVLAVTAIAWFAILITGHYPRGLFGFVTGVLRWYLRLVGYFASFNDRFPPFALSDEAGPAGKGAALASAIAGILLVGGCAGGIATIAILSDDTDRTTVDYEALLDGQASRTFVTGHRFDPTFAVRLERATDPADDLLALVDIAGTRTVVFDLSMYNGTGGDRRVEPGDARLRIEEDDGDRDWVEPALMVVEGEPAPADLEHDEDAEVRVAFAIPDDARPVELRVDPPWPSLRAITFEFR